MQFEIPCPNGHTVRFSLKLAGRLCQCPKCSAKIPIPSLDELRESVGDETDEAVAEAFREAYENQAKIVADLKAKKAAAEKAAAEEKAIPQSPIVTPVEIVKEEDVIEFACPNGHQLSAATDQAGKPGTCPQCGTRFIVPGPDGDDEDEEAEEEKAAPVVGIASPFDFASPVQVEPPQVRVPPVVEEKTPKTRVSRASGKGDSSPAFLFPDLAVKEGGLDFGLEEAGDRISALAKVDAMARLFWKFWDRRDDNTIIEVHTDDGRVFIPEEFFEDESLGEIGVFRVQNSSAHLVTIGIRWAKICRIQEKTS